MEEVIGSIPIRSTNYFNNLDDLALFEKGPKRSNKSLLSFGPRFERLCCINFVGRSSSVTRFPSGGDNEDVEQLVYEAHLVFDMRLTREAMSSADHPHHLEPLHRSGGRLHCLKASRGANDSLQCAVVGFNDVVQILARAKLGVA